MIFDDKEVLTQLIKFSLSDNSTGIIMDLRTSMALFKAIWKDSETTVGWTSFSRSLRLASSKAPATTTTEVVPSPASMSYALEISTNILAVGWTTSIYLRIVAPSFVIKTSPRASYIILSMPLGPKLVRTTSEIALAALIFDDLMSSLFYDLW